jgi:hypothetical protein
MATWFMTLVIQRAEHRDTQAIRVKLRRAPIGWNQDDFNMLEDGVVVGRIFLSPAAPQDRPWMWASGHNADIKRAAFGYESVAALAH